MANEKNEITHIRMQFTLKRMNGFVRTKLNGYCVEKK